jgi:hypothetical protein
VRRHHRVVDHDRASHPEPGFLGERDLRADADRDHHQVARHALAAGKAQPAHAIRAGDLLGGAIEQHLDAERAQRGRQQRGGARVELAFHQAIDQVHDRDRTAERGHAARGLEAEQAAADHRRAAGLRGACGDRRALLPARGTRGHPADRRR